MDLEEEPLKIKKGMSWREYFRRYGEQ